MTWTMNGWGWPAMVLMMLLFWGGIIALVATTWRRSDRRISPLQILEERFARGEISAEQLAEAKQGLEPAREGG